MSCVDTCQGLSSALMTGWCSNEVACGLGAEHVDACRGCCLSDLHVKADHVCICLCTVTFPFACDWFQACMLAADMFACRQGYTGDTCARVTLPSPTLPPPTTQLLPCAQGWINKPPTCCPTTLMLRCGTASQQLMPMPTCTCLQHAAAVGTTWPRGQCHTSQQLSLLLTTTVTAAAAGAVAARVVCHHTSPASPAVTVTPPVAAAPFSALRAFSFSSSTSPTLRAEPGFWPVTRLPSVTTYAAQSAAQL